MDDSARQPKYFLGYILKKTGLDDRFVYKM